MINSSSVTAVFKIARSRRYDLATMVEETPASSSPARHSRTVSVSSWPSGIWPSVGARCRRMSERYTSDVRGPRRGCWLALQTSAGESIHVSYEATVVALGEIASASPCGGPPTASIPKTRDQPEEPTRNPPDAVETTPSTGISRVPPANQQMRGPTSDKQDAPLLAATTTGGARTTHPVSVRAGGQRPADSTPHRSDRSAQDMRMRSMP
jgi:hypothetical protein